MNSSASLIFYKKVFILLAALFAAGTSSGQYYSRTWNVSSAQGLQAMDSLIPKKTHSPRKATILSAVLPGAGQAYNRKYWKIPVVYAAAGTSIFFIIRNNSIYKDYRTAYTYRIDNDTLTNDLKYKNLANETVRSERERFLRYRDISILCLIGVYALNIIDANVDAHLFYFDVGEDLSLSWQPAFRPFSYKPGLNFGLTYKLH